MPSNHIEIHERMLNLAAEFRAKSKKLKGGLILALHFACRRISELESEHEGYQITLNATADPREGEK